MSSLSQILEARGYVHQYSSESLSEIVDGAKRTLYLGLDPTADSIHVGQLSIYLLLRHLADDGHKIILLIGGGTGLIGDPKLDAERPLADEGEVAKRAEKIIAQARVLLGGISVEIVNNHDWLKDISLLPFLRDIGKHFSVNDMLRKDSVRGRIEGDGKTISYTEFSYQVLQAYDFLNLHKEKGVDLQIGGSDQWGNIAAGIELIRKKTGDVVYGFTAPLLVDAKTGRKFGKSEGGAVWLDAEKTSPFQFYQFWFNVGDDEVEGFLKRMTLISLSDITTIMDEHHKAPFARGAQRALARATTELVHGVDAANSVEHVSNAVFGNVDLAQLTGEGRALLEREVQTHAVAIGETLDDVLARSGLASSKREARQFLEQGAVTINGGKITDPSRNIMHEDFQNAGIALLKRGKQQVRVLTQRV